jgi:hypothetical protein
MELSRLRAANKLLAMVLEIARKAAYFAKKLL